MGFPDKAIILIALIWALLAIPLFTIIEIISQLVLGYRKQEKYPLWIRFRVWYAVCAAARLERQAMADVIGDRAVSLLESEANKESRPWTITESLERLRK